MSSVPVMDPSAPRDQTRSRSSSLSPRSIAARFGLLGLTVALFIFFSVLPKTSTTFLTTANIESIVANQSILAIASLAVLIPLLTDEFDLTVGAVVGLAAVALASAISDYGIVVPLAFVVALICAMLVGLVNATIVNVLKVNSLIGTLGMIVVIEGVVQAHTGGSSIVSGIPTGLTNFGVGKFLGVPNVFWVVIVVAVVLGFILNHTNYGRELSAVGSNREASRLVGIRVLPLIASTFVLSAALACVGGILEVARTGTANPTIGTSFTLPAFAAVYLGAAAIRPGRFNIPGTILAIYFLAILDSGLTLAGVADYFQSIANGLALIVGVSVSTLAAQGREKL